MSDKNYQESMSLVIVANDYPNRLLANHLKQAHTAQYFQEIYLRWRELFELLPEARKVKWHEKIDFEDEELFYNNMRMVVESNATPTDVYEDIVAAVDGLTLRWTEFISMVPEAGEMDWFAIAKRFPNTDPTLDEDDLVE